MTSPRSDQQERAAPPMPYGVTEAQWQRTVIEIARTYGWQTMHHLISRGTSPGWPDLVIASHARRRLLFVELKSDKGRIRPEQRYWLRLLDACGQEAGLWRPRDQDDVIGALGPRNERVKLPAELT
jgi:hypothetical protein